MQGKPSSHLPESWRMRRTACHRRYVISPWTCATPAHPASASSRHVLLARSTSTGRHSRDSLPTVSGGGDTPGFQPFWHIDRSRRHSALLLPLTPLYLSQRDTRPDSRGPCCPIL